MPRAFLDRMSKSGVAHIRPLVLKVAIASLWSSFYLI